MPLDASNAADQDAPDASDVTDATNATVQKSKGSSSFSDSRAGASVFYFQIHK